MSLIDFQIAVILVDIDVVDLVHFPGVDGLLCENAVLKICGFLECCLQRLG